MGISASLNQFLTRLLRTPAGGPDVFTFNLAQWVNIYPIPPPTVRVCERLACYPGARSTLLHPTGKHNCGVCSYYVQWRPFPHSLNSIKGENFTIGDILKTLHMEFLFSVWSCSLILPRCRQGNAEGPACFYYVAVPAFIEEVQGFLLLRHFMVISCDVIKQFFLHLFMDHCQAMATLQMALMPLQGLLQARYGVARDGQNIDLLRRSFFIKYPSGRALSPFWSMQKVLNFSSSTPVGPHQCIFSVDLWALVVCLD